MPTGPNTCRLEWLFTTKKGTGVTWYAEDLSIFNQDRIVVERADPYYQVHGDDFECSVEADASKLMVRQIVRLAEAGAWDEKRSRLKPRRLIQVPA